MKRVLAFMLAMMMLLCGCSSPANEPVESEVTTTTEVTSTTEETTVATEDTSSTVESEETTVATKESGGASPAPTSEVTTTTEETSSTIASDTTPSPEGKADFEITPANEVRYATADLNVRATPEQSGERISHVDKGDEVTVTGWVDNGWARIKFRDGEYFVNGKYLSKDKPVVTTAATTTEATSAKPESTSSDKYTKVPVTKDNFGSISGDESKLKWQNGLTADGVTLVSFKLPKEYSIGTEIQVKIKGRSNGNFRVWLLDEGVATFSNQVNAENDLGFSGGDFDLSFELVTEDFDGSGSKKATQIAFKAPTYDSTLSGFTISEIKILVGASKDTGKDTSTKKAVYGYDEGTPKLKDVFAEWFDVGSAIGSYNLNDKNSKEYKMITSQFNIFTMENEMKIDHIQGREGQFNFNGADKFVDFCTKNGYKMRGHTLVWHSQCPDWFFFDGNRNASADLVLDRMETHITTVMTRYKGKVDTWDVCNEIMEDNGQLRDSYWLQRVGDYDGDGDKYDYIEQAFIIAHKADPDARLIINDYNLEWSESKTRAYYNLIKSMLQDGIQVDGMGFQCHIGVNTDINQFRRNMQILEGLRKYNPDFVFEITELDMSVYEWWDTNEVSYTKALSDKQTKKYEELFELFIEYSEKGMLDTVVFWGLSDNNSWLNKANQKNYPMLFDRSYKMKDCFYAVMDVAEKHK